VLEQQQKTVWPSQQSNRQQKQANKQKQSSAAQRRRSRGPPVLSNDALPVLARADWPAASPVQARIIPQWEWRRRDCLHLHLTRHTSEPCLWRFSRSLPNESLLVRSRSLPNQVVVLPCLAMPCHALPCLAANANANAKTEAGGSHMQLHYVCRYAVREVPPALDLAAAGFERFRLCGTSSLRPTTLAAVINRCFGCRPAVCR
jgi:hypothetical protein